ncbi:MAG: type VI secretion system baseplate subunit TssG [Ideonella sp. MAG2]|nr:MAG: type VI secretion system baseplate subunit TssG [Ideonella sp. MAG2]
MSEAAQSVATTYGGVELESPWQYGFLALLRRISAEHPEWPLLGEASSPRQEAVRIGQVPSMSFAAREVASLDAAEHKLVVKLFGLGMLGPNGPLPLHMTDQVREQWETKRDLTLANFLDLFHHRALTLLYRAWAQAQATAGLDRPEAESFSPYVARLVGDEPDSVVGSALPAHARWATAAHRVRPSRNPDGLVAAVAHFFGVPCRLQEFQLQWMRLAPQDECHMGWARASSMMGQGAVAGEAVPDRQSCFRLVLGPLSLDQYLRFTPEGSPSGRDLPALIELVRSFVGLEYDWEVELLVRRDAAPACRMGDAQQLGWSTWMGTAPDTQGLAISGMVFHPESYTHSSSN